MRKREEKIEVAREKRYAWGLIIVCCKGLGPDDVVS